jgi:hypothetical protein
MYEEIICKERGDVFKLKTGPLWDVFNFPAQQSTSIDKTERNLTFEPQPSCLKTRKHKRKEQLTQDSGPTVWKSQQSWLDFEN